jgi:hypothetical protein
VFSVPVFHVDRSPARRQAAFPPHSQALTAY